MRTNKVLEIFNCIEKMNEKMIFLLKAEYSNEEKELIIKYAKAYDKEVKFVTMREFLFNKGDNILKFK